jgi:hypothetical protein
MDVNVIYLIQTINNTKESYMRYRFHGSPTLYSNNIIISTAPPVNYAEEQYWIGADGATWIEGGDLVLLPEWGNMTFPSTQQWAISNPMMRRFRIVWNLMPPNTRITLGWYTNTNWYVGFDGIVESGTIHNLYGPPIPDPIVVFTLQITPVNPLPFSEIVSEINFYWD